MLTTGACGGAVLVVREGLGCCCGMTLTASDSSRKLSRRGERASSMLFTTLHSLRYTGGPSHDIEKDIGKSVQRELIPEQLACCSQDIGMAMDCTKQER